MKRILFILIMATILVFEGLAQGISAKYQGEADLGYSVGVGAFPEGRINLHTIQGVKICDYFFAGFGIGFDYYVDSSSNIGSGDLFVPIFFNMKGYIPVRYNFTPYVSLDLGYGVGVTEYVSGDGGFLWSPSIGLKYRKFKFQVGYTCQRISEYGFGYDMAAVQFKIGMVF